MDRKFSRHFQNVIGFSFIMTFLALFGGITAMILMRPVQSVVPFESFFILSNSLFLTIGQALIFGVLLPLGFAFVGWSMRDHLAAKRVQLLSRAFRVYAAGAVLTALVHIYQDAAMAFVLVRGAAGDLATANADLFMGHTLIRTALYTGSHLVLGTGAIWYAAVLWRSLIDVRRAIESISAE